MKEIEVRAMLKHQVHPELADMLEKVETAAAKEVLGPEVMLYDVDMSRLENDIHRIARKSEEINRALEVAKYPWIARDLLEGKAAYFAGRLVYMPPFRPNTFREKLEKIVGPLTEAQFKSICKDTTDDIKANLIGFGKKTEIDQVIKIAAISFDVLKRCGA